LAAAECEGSKVKRAKGQALRPHLQAFQPSHLRTAPPHGSPCPLLPATCRLLQLNYSFTQRPSASAALRAVVSS
jgi:hypothetical protein